MSWTIEGAVPVLPFREHDLVSIGGIFFRAVSIKRGDGAAVTIVLDWVPREQMPDEADVFVIETVFDEISALVH